MAITFCRMYFSSVMAGVNLKNPTLNLSRSEVGSGGALRDNGHFLYRHWLKLDGVGHEPISECSNWGEAFGVHRKLTIRTEKTAAEDCRKRISEALLPSTQNRGRNEKCRTTGKSGTSHC